MVPKVLSEILFKTKLRIFQKLAIVGLLIVGQVLAAPERHRRDAPILPTWGVPNTGYEGRTEFGIGGGYDGFRAEGGVIVEEYGVPHEEYGPPPVPHEEYGVPELKIVPETTPQ
jgi:hypothetical protein